MFWTPFVSDESDVGVNVIRGEDERLLIGGVGDLLECERRRRGGRGSVEVSCEVLSAVSRAVMFFVREVANSGQDM